MRRREFITLLGGAASCVALTARAEQAPAIGFLSIRSAENDAKLVTAFKKGLDETGRRTPPSIEYRFAEGDRGRLTALAAELTRQHVAIIVAADGASALARGRRAWRSLAAGEKRQAAQQQRRGCAPAQAAVDTLSPADPHARDCNRL